MARFIAKHIDRLNELRIIKTTCPETDQRYDAARTLATESDLLIVVGGKNSAADAFESTSRSVTRC